MTESDHRIASSSDAASERKTQDHSLEESSRHDGFWRRLRHTPLSRSLLGRVDGSLDREAIVARAGLPSDLRELVEQTVRRTRLPRHEMAEVARDLTEHFRDGLEGGVASEDLRRDFGEPSVAASLIRRSMIRKRPWLGRQLRLALRVSAASVVLLASVYLLVAVRDWRQRPNVSIDHVAMLNAPIAASDPNDRAWPLLREGISRSRDRVVFEHPGHPITIDEHQARAAAMSRLLEQARDALPAWSGPSPALAREEPRLPEETVEAFFAGNEDSRRMLLEAAARPLLGFEIRTAVPSDPEDRTFLNLIEPTPPSTDPAASFDPFQGSLMTVQLPYLGSVRTAARILAADAGRAVVAGDGRRALEDLEAIFALANLVREPAFLITQLVGIAIDQVAYEIVLDALADRPDAFTTEDLDRLAAMLDAQTERRFVVDLGPERLFFEDVAQRIYTDDGEGDGRLAVAGIGAMNSMSGLDGGDEADRGLVPFLIGPILSRYVLSRAEATEIWNELFDHYERLAATPVWRLGSFDSVRTEETMVELGSGGVGAFRYFPLNLLAPAIDKAVLAGHALRIEHSLARAVVGLEIERRRTGAWPELLPASLRGIDPFNGESLQYGILDGQPTFWSVGWDRDDDRGVEPAKRRRVGAGAGRVPTRLSATVDDWGRVGPNTDPTVDGDLVAWRSGGERAASRESVSPRDAAEAGG